MTPRTEEAPERAVDAAPATAFVAVPIAPEAPELAAEATELAPELAPEATEEAPELAELATELVPEAADEEAAPVMVLLLIVLFWKRVWSPDRYRRTSSL